jgi:putative transposase
MTTELVRTTSTVGECNLHLQITPAYRKDIFADPQVRDLTRLFIYDKLKQLKITILAEDCGPDHWHFFLANWKNYSIPEIAQYVKGYSSYMMRKCYSNLFIDKLWGDKFWSEGYFYRTVGVVTKETVKRYVEESQGKHWIALTSEQYAKSKEQMSLLQFN